MGVSVGVGVDVGVCFYIVRSYITCISLHNSHVSPTSFLRKFKISSVRIHYKLANIRIQNILPHICCSISFLSFLSSSSALEWIIIHMHFCFEIEFIDVCLRRSFSLGDSLGFPRAVRKGTSCTSVIKASLQHLRHQCLLDWDDQAVLEA